MKKFEKKDKRTELDKEIDELYELIRREEDTTSDNYNEILGKIEKLEKLRNERKRATPQRAKIDPNTLIALGGQLSLALLVMHHEELRVITSKAWQLLPKPRIF